MKFTDVESVPEKRFDKPFHKSVGNLLDQFMNSDSEVVRVDTDPGEYSSPESICVVINQSIRRKGYSLKVCKRGNDIYVRKEFE